MPFNLPIALTFARIALLPVFIIFFFLPFHWSFFWSAFIFWLASCTDALDGFIARKFNLTTRFGAFLDPVADKIMVMTALVLLVHHYSSLWMTLPALIMIGREIVISALREWMAEIGKRGVVSVSWIGKAKTASQMSAITFLIWQYSPLIINIGYILLYIATILTCWSMIIYMRAAWADLIKEE